MVLTLDALDYPEEVWNFFVSNGILSFGFNVEEIEGANLRSSLDHLQAARKYQAFFRRLLELREGYNRRVRIREIDDAVNKLMNASGEVGSSENSPLSIVSFDYEGNLSTYSPELLTSVHPKYGRFVFGNVKQLESLEEILSNRKLMSINSEIQAGVTRCKRVCSYFSVCGGGSPSNKFSENKSFDSTETMNCKFRIKLLNDVVLDYTKHAKTMPSLAASCTEIHSDLPYQVSWRDFSNWGKNWY